MTNADRFPASRAAALERLDQFAPLAGQAYAQGRNTDFGPSRPGAVSRLAPYLRYRLLTEEDVVAAVLDRHSLPDADKFVQEVLWRTYWKGWLEMRPSVWSRFLAERYRQRDQMTDTTALSQAEAGRTGIEGFDDWAHELVRTGYLHNHARMWFASIWIFTLRLPWALGADFFLRHLIDADAASNTLSWRWVAGLQTAGKTYLATADNITRYTEGRFDPKGLANEAVALTEEPLPKAQPLPALPLVDQRAPSLLLVTPDDLHPETVIDAAIPLVGATVVADPGLSWGQAAADFVAGAASNAAARTAAHFNCPTSMAEMLDAERLIAAATAAGAIQIVTPYAPVGAVADRLRAIAPTLAAAGLPLVPIRRAWDDIFWPHATKGFFPFKEKIPGELRAMGLL